MTIKLALDPQMFYATSSVYELPDIVARCGYDWMELSPKGDFIPFFKYPRVDDAGVQRLKKIASDAGVGIASVLPVQRWSGPDEDQRQAAVRTWKRIIQITVDLGVEIINTEFNGRPEAPETAEAMFLKSLDELLPIFEGEGLQLIIEPHPDDFIEDGIEAVNLIRGLDHLRDVAVRLRDISHDQPPAMPRRHRAPLAPGRPRSCDQPVPSERGLVQSHAGKPTHLEHTFDRLATMPIADHTHASALHGEALLQARRPELDALIAHLEALANGHDDTRVEVAGNMAGAWFAAPETGDAHTLIAAGLLLLAGPVDRDALVDAVQAGYEGAGGAV